MISKKGNINLSHVELSKVLEKLRNVAQSANESAGISSVEKEAILRKRAEKLSEKISETETFNSIEAIEFKLSGETYAIETNYLKEVFHLKEIIPVPNTPSFVKGIINLRGNIISVLDIKEFFELPEGPVSNYDRAIILEDGDMVFGILADEIEGIKKISLENSTSSLSDLNAARQKYLKTVTSSRIVLLDGSKLLRDKSLVVNNI